MPKLREGEVGLCVRVPKELRRSARHYAIANETTIEKLVREGLAARINPAEREASVTPRPEGASA
jgi:hypothetical protein